MAVRNAAVAVAAGNVARFLCVSSIWSGTVDDSHDPITKKSITRKHDMNIIASTTSKK